jgi:hypothetical protein
MTRIDFSDDFSHNLLRLVNFVFIVFIVIFAALNYKGEVAQVVRASDSYPPRRTRVQKKKKECERGK